LLASNFRFFGPALCPLWLPHPFAQFFAFDSPP
jgi:hypothetical protein